MPGLFDTNDYVPTNSSVSRLIESYEQQFLPLFKKIKTDWNPKIREFLRESTGLKLNLRNFSSRNQREAGVEILIKPDFENHFIKRIDDDYPNLDFFEYEHLKELNNELFKTKPYFQSNLNSEHVKLKSYCEEYLMRYDLKQIVQKLFVEETKDREIWGAYFYNETKVEVYYLPLIVLNKITGIPFEYAFVVVLIHELAHAYHHIGKDSDGKFWAKMKYADNAVKEGLAQYYTHLFVEEHKYIYPALFETFKRMVSMQSGVYRTHESWTNYKKEALKTSLLLIRSEARQGLDEFEWLLKEMDTRLTKS